MEQLSKIVTRQDANFKLSPSPSNETSINLSKEISALISDESGEVTFMLYKSDFIKALAALCVIPQIYLKKNQDPSSVSDIFASLSNEIAAQFDKSETAPYTVYLFKRDDGRAYFNNLKQDNGFNLRAFLVEKYSTLIFIKNDNSTLSIRLNISVPDEALLKEEPLIPDEELAPLDELLQQIFYGAPGTGKSHTIEQMCSKYENYRTTFHPDTDYASFVGSYKPITIKTDVRDMAGHIVYEKGEAVKESRIVYRYVMQAFLKAYVAAWREQQNDEPKPVFLIVEEINRGNCAQIFGDIFQLLDRNAAGFSDYPIVADDDLAQELKEILGGFSIAKHDAINALYSGGKDVVGMVKNGDCLILPNNMYIWATMNTSDQSLFPIDSAFKRRWDWNYIKIKDAGENFKIVFSNGNTYDWWGFVSAINERIEGGEIQQEDKKLGYFFAKAKDKVITPKVLLSKVLFYLYNDVFKDFGLDEDFFKGENGETMSFASYFDNNGQINEGLVERFVTNLGLESESTNHTDVVDELTVNGKKMLYITDAVFEILSEAAKSNTSEAIFDAVDEIFADRDDVVKSIDNPESYEKENRWNKTPIIANDGTAFVVSNQWHKNEIQQVKELAEHFNIPFDYALGESDNMDDESEQNDGRDYTKYMINGQGRYSKKMLAYELVKLYVEQHPEMSAFEVVKEWSSLGNIVSHFVELKEAYDSRKGTDKANRVAIVECKGEPIYVSTNGWGGKSKIQELIDAVQSKGWNMSVNEIA